eukprot:4379632-Pyramimonas_sp.AAC.1
MSIILIIVSSCWYHHHQQHHHQHHHHHPHPHPHPLPSPSLLLGAPAVLSKRRRSRWVTATLSRATVRCESTRSTLSNIGPPSGT